MTQKELDKLQEKALAQLSGKATPLRLKIWNKAELINNNACFRIE